MDLSALIRALLILGDDTSVELEIAYGPEPGTPERVQIVGVERIGSTVLIQGRDAFRRAKHGPPDRACLITSALLRDLGDRLHDMGRALEMEVAAPKPKMGTNGSGHEG